MKKFSLIFFLFISQISYLTSFSQSKSKIVLKNKTIIKDVKIWHLYFNKIEYEAGGSLHDMLNSAIERIETDTAILSFDDNGNALSRPYDFIVKANDDTVYCIISQLGGNYIYYYPKGKENRSYISTSTLKDYRKFEPQLLPQTKKKPDEKIISPQDSTNENKITTPVSPPEIFSDSVKQIQDTVVKITLYETKEEGKEQETFLESPAEYSENDDQILQQSIKNDLCYESYMKGIRDASQKDEIIWAFGGFCVNGCCTGAFPAYTYWAQDKDDPVPTIPTDVDERCYTLGYQNQKKQNRIENASIGGMSAAVIFLGAFIYYIAVLGGI